MDSLLCAVFKDILLGSVMEQLVKFECPLLFLVINDAPLLVLSDSDGDGLKQNMQRLAENV